MTKFTDFIDSRLPVGGIIRRMPYVMVFKTTNFCWYNCPHCCENSGPIQPKNYIPASEIKNYVAQASHDVKFARDVVFTGGEVFSAYQFGEKNYVPEIINFCMDGYIGVDIKTNGAWVRTGYARDVFRDLTQAVAGHWPYGLQISLSLDKYHVNSVENCARVISGMARGRGKKIMIHITSFRGQENLRKDLLHQLHNRGLKLTDGLIGNTNDDIRSVKVVNGETLLDFSIGELFAGGRAAKIPEAKANKFPEFSFLLPSGQVLMAFDSFGQVSLGENSGKKISAPWRDKSNVARPLTDIRRDLILDAQKKEITARILHGFNPMGKNK